MAGPGGVQPFTIPLGGLQGLPTGLRVGQTFQAVVQGQPGNLSVVVGGTRVAIGDLPQLTPGQVVNGEVTRVDSGLQIRLSAPPPGTPAQATSSASLPQIVASVLESFSALGAAEDAAHALSASMPANYAAVKNTLSLFLSDARTGADLQLILAAMNDAAQAGGLSQTLADNFGLLVSALVFAGGRDVRALLEAWRRGGRTVEGRLALAMQSGRLEDVLSEIEGDLRGLLMRVRDDESLLRFLRGEGRLRAFQDAAERVLDRLTGSALQNLKSLEQPYLFVEVPSLENSGLERLQIHFMGERGVGGRRIDPRNCTVAIDISLSRLGDLWITLNVVDGRCSCFIRATGNESLETLKGERAGFVEALQLAGYEGGQVRFGLWEGDRLREVGEFMRQHARMDMRA